MATTKDAIYKVHNGVDFDTIHFQTGAEQVIANDGSNLESRLVDKTKYFMFKRTRNQTIHSGDWQTIGWNIFSNYNEADFCILNADGTITFTQSGIYEIQISLMWGNAFLSHIYPTKDNNIGASFEIQNIFVSCFKEYAAGEIWGGRVAQNTGSAKDILSDTRTTMYIRQAVKL